MRMAILMLWGSGCSSFRNTSLCIQLLAYHGWAVIMCCTARDTMAVLCMAALFGRFTTGRIITVGTRIGIFPRKRRLKGDILSRHILMVTFIY